MPCTPLRMPALHGSGVGAVRVWSPWAPLPSPVTIMEASGLTPDDWQRRLLEQRPSRALVRCCRQSGKSTVAGAAALDVALSTPKSLVLLVSPSQRQSSEIMQRVRDLLTPLAGQPGIVSTKPVSESILSLRLQNRSRILSLPASETTIRGYSASLVLLDEAAYVPDSLIHAILPMLAATNGRLIGLSTPRQRAGWFYNMWTQGDPAYMRIKVTASECGRISAEHLAEAKATMPTARFAAEYMVSFTESEAQVFRSSDIDYCFDIARSGS